MPASLFVWIYSSSNSQKALVPKLRFRAEDGAEYPKLTPETVGSLFAHITRRNSDMANKNVITNSAEYGLIPQRDFFDKDIAVEGNTDKYYIIGQGDFVYNPRKSTTAPYGPFNCYRGEEEGIVSPLYTCLKPLRPELTDYLLWYFSSPAWHSYIYHNGAQGGARHDRVGMTNELMDGIPINLPCQDEQKKISKFLSTVDARLSAHQRLVDSLKLYKRGAFQHLFSQSIQGSPEVSLGSITVCHDSKRIPINAQTRSGREGVYPYYGANGIQGYIDDFIFDGDYILLAEDGGHFEEFYNRPIAQFISGKCWVNNHAHILEATGCEPKYLFYILEHMDIRSYINGTSRAKLNQEDMLSIRIPLPSHKTQKQFAIVLESIVKRLEVLQKSLYSTERLKKGLLASLFI